MLEFLGKNYYIDVDTIIKKCRPTDPPAEFDEDNNEIENKQQELNVFKYETFRTCIERVLGEYEEPDNNLGVFNEEKLSPSFKIAFNTLLKYEILIDENYEQ